MNWATSQLCGGARPLCLGLAFVFFSTGVARAGLILIGYNGITPYAPDETTVLFPPSPAVLDRVRPDAPRLGSGETIVDSRGQIKTIYITAPTLNDLKQPFSVGPYSVNAQLHDTAHFVGTGTVTIKFETVGFGVLPQPDFNNDLEYDTALSALTTSGPEHIATAQFASKPLQGYTVPIPNVPFFIDLVVEDTFRVSGTTANPDDVPFFFLLTASGLGGASLNLSDTSQLSFVLQPGVSVSTDGGFSQSGSVPEPSSLLLLSAGLACLLGFQCQLTKRHRRIV